DEAVHRSAAQPAVGWLLTRRTRRRVLELAAACGDHLDGSAADGLEADASLGSRQPDIAAEVAARQANRLDQRIGCFSGGHQVTGGPDDRQHPAARGYDCAVLAPRGTG